MATRALQFIRHRHYAAPSGRKYIWDILTQGVASLALGYVVLGFQPVLGLIGRSIFLQKRYIKWVNLLTNPISPTYFYELSQCVKYYDYICAKLRGKALNSRSPQSA